jgi:acetyl-CoA carboxylase biotin carboxylase subunit
MVAKLIVLGTDREHALARMNRALGELMIEGIMTNKTQQQWIVNDRVFRSGSFGTSYYGSIRESIDNTNDSINESINEGEAEHGGW